jgi:hypothetical protein
VTNLPPMGLVTLVTWNNFDHNEDDTNVTNSLGGGFDTLVIWNFIKPRQNEDVTNIINPPPRGFVTLVTWNYIDRNKDVINTTYRPPRELLTLGTSSF